MSTSFFIIRTVKANLIFFDTLYQEMSNLAIQLIIQKLCIKKYQVLYN